MRNSHKTNVKLNPRKEGFKPSHLLKNRRNPSQDEIDSVRVMRENPKKPLKCLGCKGPYLRRNCPLENGNEGQVPSTQEAKTVGQKEGIIPKICVVLEYR